MLLVLWHMFIFKLFKYPLHFPRIQLMQESGVLDHWKEKNSPKRAECFDFDSSLHGQSEIALEDLQGPFYLLVIGLCFGLTFLFSECAWNKTKIAYGRYKKRKLFKRQLSAMYW